MVGYMAKGQRLDWLCRRGTRELDLLLQGYLKKVYPHAPDRHQNAFERMLDLSDPELYALLTSEGKNVDTDTADVIEAIRAHFSPPIKKI